MEKQNQKWVDVEPNVWKPQKEVKEVEVVNPMMAMAQSPEWEKIREMRKSW